MAGNTIDTVTLVAEGNSPAGNWEEDFADMAIVSTDGTVEPLYGGAASASGSPWGTSGFTLSGFGVQKNAVAGGDTYFYQGDHLGSARIMTAAGGWPLSSSTFYPFGQEAAVNADTSHYKFASLERDADPGLGPVTDHATFRQYSPATGSWMSPDPWDGSYDLANPQSLNRYAYVLNNPMRYVDPSGLDACYTEGCIGTDPCPANDCSTQSPTNSSPDPCAYDACVTTTLPTPPEPDPPVECVFNCVPVATINPVVPPAQPGNNSGGSGSNNKGAAPQVPWLPQGRYAQGQGKAPGPPTQPPSPRPGPGPEPFLGPNDVPPPGGMGQWMYILMQLMRIMDNNAPLLPVIVNPCVDPHSPACVPHG